MCNYYRIIFFIDHLLLLYFSHDLRLQNAAPPPNRIGKLLSRARARARVLPEDLSWYAHLSLRAAGFSKLLGGARRPGSRAHTIACAATHPPARA